MDRRPRSRRRCEVPTAAVSCRDRLDQPERSWDTPDWLGWDCHRDESLFPVWRAEDATPAPVLRPHYLCRRKRGPGRALPGASRMQRLACANPGPRQTVLALMPLEFLDRRAVLVAPPRWSPPHGATRPGAEPERGSPRARHSGNRDIPLALNQSVGDVTRPYL
jgi:hypothetical protein